jgi:hypothetical protein
MVGGLIVRSKYKFPHQVIQGGPRVLDAITNNKGNFYWDRHSVLDSKEKFISGTVWLHHHFCWATLKISLKFNFEGLEMFCGPDDFLLNGI